MQNRIETYDTLWSLVDLDKKDHLIKELSKLFLAAMQDWPTTNQDNISEFVSELTNYFGKPLTFERVKSKSFSGMNAWQIESAGSLLDMLKLYYKYNGPIELDELISKLLLHYNKEYSVVDFIAELHYLPTEEGGRKAPAASGYRPQLAFDFMETQTSGQQTFIDKELAYPGDLLRAKIKVLSPQFLEGNLFDGIKFEFREGPNLIGTGVVKYIVNSKLEKEEQVTSPKKHKEFPFQNKDFNEDKVYYFKPKPK